MCNNRYSFLPISAQVILVPSNQMFLIRIFVCLFVDNHESTVKYQIFWFNHHIQYRLYNSSKYSSKKGTWTIKLCILSSFIYYITYCTSLRVASPQKKDIGHEIPMLLFVRERKGIWTCYSPAKHQFPTLTRSDTN